MTESGRNRFVLLAALGSLLLQTLTFVSLAFGGALSLNSRLTAVETKLELLIQSHRLVGK